MSHPAISEILVRARRSVALSKATAVVPISRLIHRVTR
jgi:hypothetical protein